MVRENTKEEKIIDAVALPPQCSMELEAHGRENDRYFTWRIKVYCDDLDECKGILIEKNKQMMEYVKSMEKQ
jgi:hypothetical protein